ncbi:hypothetical protein WI93_12090 [Burkholderia vietnamiensis]|uniref:DUF4224 domain-containing protein n=1 Tax=Burkholderia vietnamiensis TaxID=60552 RepID=UPI000754A767|nr:DUF4224 domain-containing protein [Burkholderia vietnamiensis]KVE27766.1 hypothetical protein WI93_12090 [Burkholderia vietnamiensis]
MSLYLTTLELAELVGCKPRSHACMKRWLERNHWPFAVNIAGVPLVAREYYDARMTGMAPPAAHPRQHRAAAEQEPNFDALAA